MFNRTVAMMDETKPDEYRTSSGIPIEPVYTDEDLPGDLPERLGSPGEFPFTRGIYPEMYRFRHWTMRQYAGYSTAEASNQRYRYLLDQGVTGLSVAFDLPTQMGYDSDAPLADGEVGKVGVAIDSLADMEQLFEGIPLEKVTTSMTINATAPILLAMYVVLARRQQIDLERLGGTIQNDILKEYAARGTHIYPPAPSMRLITDVFEWCSRELPRWNTISISGYHMREAGATAVQELGFTLANAIAYVRAAVEQGLDADVFGSRLSFFFNCHNDFFEEIAKFRAARRLWSTIMKDRFGATNPKTMQCRFHVQTGGSTLTAQQPENNVSRVTLQALAAVLGGTQSLHTNAKDEALSLPSKTSARTALRTQQIIAHETGVPETVDPLAGSYYVERLTKEVEDRSRALIEQVEERGGAVQAITDGFYQDEIARSAYEYQRAVDRGDEVIVGVNRFTEDGDLDVEETFDVDESIQQQQIESLEEIRASRDTGAVRSALEKLERAADGDENLMPHIISAVDAYATVGEISDTLRSVWGEWR